MGLSMWNFYSGSMNQSTSTRFRSCWFKFQPQTTCCGSILFRHCYYMITHNENEILINYLKANMISNIVESLVHTFTGYSVQCYIFFDDLFQSVISKQRLLAFSLGTKIGIIHAKNINYWESDTNIIFHQLVFKLNHPLNLVLFTCL